MSGLPRRLLFLDTNSAFTDLARRSFVVAGCTTGSLYPWYPNLRDKVLSLYLAAVLSSLTREDAARP
jgi:hypothetical protein